MTETLNGQLAALHAERVGTWDKAALQVNIDQRARLVKEAEAARFIRAGETVDDFVLEEVDAGRLTRDNLLRTGPVVLVFFRFATCPACNIALPYYQRHLAVELAQLGATLVGVSPQVPEKLAAIKRKHDLSFRITTDRDHALARKFGIVYSFDDASRAAATAKGNPIGAVTGTGTWELPQPAVVVIGQDGVVHFADISPDWLLRTEAEPVLEAVRRLVSVSA